MARVDEDRRQAGRLVSEAEIQATAEHLAQQFPEVQAIWLFGSYAGGQQVRASTVFFGAMKSREHWDADLFDALLTASAREFIEAPVNVELVNFHTCPDRTLEMVRRRNLLFARDPNEVLGLAQVLRGVAQDEVLRREYRRCH